MYRILRRLLRNLPFLHKTLEQDLHNPLQRDRLPDTRNIELEFPVVSGSLEENRRLTRKWIWIALAVSFIISTIQIVFDQWFITLFSRHVAALGFLLAWLSYLAVRQPPMKWFLLWMVTPLVVLALQVLDDPTFSLIVAGLMCVLVADLFATHYLHLQTTAPMDRQRTIGLRRRWKHRFGFFRGVAGAELYLVAFLLPLAVVLTFIWADQKTTAAYAIRNLQRFAGLAAGVIAATVVLEVLAAFLFARGILNPRMMFRHLKTALIHWLTYNRTEIDAPGAYQTPAGSCKCRKRMAMGILLIVTAAVSHFVSSRRDIQLTMAGRHPTYNTEQPPKKEPAASGPATPSLPASELPGEDANQLPGEPDLQVYQQRMLERMPPDKREAYLTRLKQEREHDVEQNAQSAPPQRAKAQPDNPAYEELFVHPRTKAVRKVLLSLASLVLPFLNALLCLGTLFAFVFATTGRLAARFGPTTSVSPDELLSSERWDQLVSRVQSSKDETERESLLLGVNAADNTPVLVPRDVFTEHAHLLGDSGSGKTSIGIASILSQLIRRRESLKKCSLVVLDLKGDDLALFQSVRRDAEDAGLRFRWFTNQMEHSTYAFNPLAQRPLERMTVYQKVDMLTAAMGLQYGRDYGRAYYSDANARLLHVALEQHPRIESFERLAHILSDSNGLRGVDRELRQAGAHLGAIVNRLADSEPLNVVGGDGHPQTVVDAAIEFTDLFRRPEVVHFHLTSTIGTTSAAEIARIALYSLITAATAVAPKDRVQTFVVIDEFQRIVAGNVELLLQLARSLNIGIILSNQSLMDLKTGGIDLIPAISANTRYRQIFAASNLEEQERISRGSGESLTFQQSWHEYIGGLTTLVDGRNFSEHITPRLRINDILLATDHPLQSIVHIRRGAGYAQYGGMPFVMRSTHHIPFDEYLRRKDANWPEKTDETLLPLISDRPRARAEQSGWFGSQDVIVDEPRRAESAGHYLDQLYQQQIAESDDDSPSANPNQPDHSPREENDND